MSDQPTSNKLFRTLGFSLAVFIMLAGFWDLLNQSGNDIHGDTLFKYGAIAAVVAILTEVVIKISDNNR